MPTIRCVVERITYQNPENGYSVLKCRVKGYSDLVPVVGNLLDANVGSVLLAEGDWKVDARYGRQFLVKSWQETLPATAYGMEKYLGSGLIRGVGPKFARRIVQKFGADTFSVIEDHAELLIEVEGIGKKRVQMIADSWEKQKEIRNVMVFLQEHQVSTAFAARIYKQYGNDSIAVMKENPYRLADDIWGIGFRTADQIASKMGFAGDSYVRLRSGLMYTLSALADEGHVYATRGQLVERAVALLEAPEETIHMTLDEMLRCKDLILERNIVPQGAETEQTFIPGEASGAAIYLPPFYYAEVGVAAKLKKLAQAPAADRLFLRLREAREKAGNPSLSVDVGAVQKRTGVAYDEIQADAIRRAADAKVMVLTGGPGTGKTTTTHGIIAAYQAYGLKILLAAPTGRAAKRMTEATGMEAKTIHRLLECKPPDGYQRDEENPLEGDALIVDECSMIDLLLMNALLKAIPPSMRLILVGDVDQLPSVGAGNVLRDVIDSGSFSVVRLTRIFRQAQESDIIMNAHRVNAGQMPRWTAAPDFFRPGSRPLGGAGSGDFPGKASDFFFLENADADSAASQIVDLVKTGLPALCHVSPSQIQVLTPMQRGVAGAANLNLLLQEALNPAVPQPGPEEIFRRESAGAQAPRPCLHRGGFTFRLGDKVMQIKNNYDNEVFNGDMGTFDAVSEQDRTLTVDFDGHLLEYDVTQLDELVHAYATTIHKAQGSEYPIVVMPVLMSHYVMLQRNLLYTGITRAKKLLVVVGSRKALACAVHNGNSARRNSLLAQRLTVRGA